MYSWLYSSPVGEIILASDGDSITGLWFAGAKYAPEKDTLNGWQHAALPVFDSCGAWLDAYFSGMQPPALPPLKPEGTEFQLRVWEELLKLGYAELISYGELARRLGCKSARAAGSAVGRNPISILIPCHRIIGSSGKLTGYAGGLARKEFLLRLERAI